MSGKFFVNIAFKEKKLLLAFAFLVLLTLLIGLVGITQIHGLNRRIEDLGTYHLKLAQSVLEMRVKNANYIMEIRSYSFWRASRYQAALPMADYVNKITQAEKKFWEQLEVYRQSARSSEQIAWGAQMDASLSQLVSMGKKNMSAADKEASSGIGAATPVYRQAGDNLMMVLEKRAFEVDRFLDNPMGRSNLEAIREQISLAKADKDHAIFFLSICLIGAFVVGTLLVFFAYSNRVQERAYRQELLNRMVNIEENERKKLSTAVHDEMGQNLSAIKIHLGLISQQMKNPGPSPGNDLQAKVEQCKKITASLIEKSHNIAFLLRPPDLDEVGLIDSLEALLLESKHMTGVTYDYEKPQDFPGLSAEYSLLFYRISQELLTNMAKHAQARHVALKLEKKSAGVELIYTDDGQGFNYEEVLGHPVRRRSEDKLRLGLLGLKERVELLDGTMRIDSAHCAGTRIMVRLPV
ncbi:MAG: hypothetical protein EXS63_09730 [Candidatus Omnitrophica bacterium]|nr:hypothetical protein [Candidatus Omnitrophota bacterium]